MHADLEVGMACTLSAEKVTSMEQVKTVFEANENRLKVADMMCELAAMAFACDATRTGTLQIGMATTARATR
jgi:Protein of unknown function (DUF1552)